MRYQFTQRDSEIDARWQRSLDETTRLAGCMFSSSHSASMCMFWDTKTDAVAHLQVRCIRSRQLPVTALHIDRRQHLELAWQRQQGEDALLKLPVSLSGSTVIEVRSLAHLDQLVDGAGSAVVLLYLYSKVK